MSELTTGSIVADKYVIEDVLGQGGMATVFAARHLHIGQRVAIKVVRNASPEAIARFLREARALGRLADEHVVRVSDVATLDSGEPMLVMERLEGQDLAHVSLPADVRAAAEWVRQAALGVAAAHAAGVVHRDLKPSNLFLVEREGRPLVKVLDFGIAKTESESVMSLTTTSDMLGSPLYMSPEQVRSPREVDGRSDVWSLGVILYELLAGKPPFSGATQAAVGASVVADAPPKLRALRPEVSRTLERVVHRCLEKKPKDRFQSAEDLAQALRGALGDRSRARMPILAAMGLCGIAVIAGAIHVFPNRLARDTDPNPARVESTQAEVAHGVPFEGRPVMSLETPPIQTIPIVTPKSASSTAPLPPPIPPTLSASSAVSSAASTDLVHDRSLILRK